MRKFTEFIVESAKKLDVQDDTLNYIPATDLQKYLEVTDKFISAEAKSVIQHLIDHNDDYVTTLGSKGAENAVVDFYDKGLSKADSDWKKDLYKNIGLLAKRNRLIEVPVFQTKEQFDAIKDKQEAPDTILLDLETEKGRNAVTKQYEPLVNKICRQYVGKSNLDYDELKSAAYTGLTFAMNRYGKRNKSEADNDKLVSKTFGQYAAYWIRAHILEDIKNVSRTVRISTSQQQKERDETGKNTRNNSVSGDKTVGSDDEGNKTLFDFMGGSEDAGRSIDNEDLDKLWKQIYDRLEKNFDAQTMDIWYSFYGLNDHKQMKNKDLAAKYGLSTSNVTYYLFKVNSFIKKDKRMFQMFTDVYELMKECLNDRDHDDDLSDVHYLNDQDI